MKINIIFFLILFLIVACKDRSKEEGQPSQSGPAQTSPTNQGEKPVPPIPTPGEEPSDEAILLKLKAKKQEINKAFADLEQKGLIFQRDFRLDLKNLMDYRIKFREENR